MKKLILAGVMLAASTVAANAVTIGGTYSISSDAAAGPTITYILGQPFTFDLDLNVPQTVAFATIFENGPASTTVNSTVTASFSFTDPEITSAFLTAADNFKRNGNSAHDALTWDNNGLLTVTFSDGSIVDITIGATTVYDGNLRDYKGLQPQVTFELVQAAHHTVPEPWTMSLFAAGLTALGGMTVLRRKQAAKTA